MCIFLIFLYSYTSNFFKKKKEWEIVRMNQYILWHAADLGSAVADPAVAALPLSPDLIDRDMLRQQQ
jgi:hypothetical protein